MVTDCGRATRPSELRSRSKVPAFAVLPLRVSWKRTFPAEASATWAAAGERERIFSTATVRADSAELLPSSHDGSPALLLGESFTITRQLPSSPSTLGTFSSAFRLTVPSAASVASWYVVPRSLAVPLSPWRKICSLHPAVVGCPPTFVTVQLTWSVAPGVSVSSVAVTCPTAKSGEVAMVTFPALKPVARFAPSRAPMTTSESVSGSSLPSSRELAAVSETDISLPVRPLMALFCAENTMAM